MLLAEHGWKTYQEAVTSSRSRSRGSASSLKRLSSKVNTRPSEGDWERTNQPVSLSRVSQEAHQDRQRGLVFGNGHIGSTWWSEVIRTSCDSEPNSKGAKVNDDIDMSAVSEEMENAECDTLDTKTGEILDPGLVAVARSEEMRYMDDIGMF